MRHPFLRTLAGSAAPAATDPNFENVTLLLHGDGTNGGQNNSFVDGSTNNFTITRNGNTTQGTFSPYGGNWSNYFDGTGDYLVTPANAVFNFGTGDFTMECWFYRQAAKGQLYHDNIFGNRATVFPGTVWHVFCGPASGDPFYFQLSVGGTGWLISGGSCRNGEWNHIAVVRSGNTFTLYINGSSVASGTQTAAVGDSTNGISVGAFRDGAYPCIGYVSNLRIVKGTAVYTANFTPSTTPLTAVTNTSLLTCQSNRFRDASTNNFTITRNGDVSVQRFSPFSPTAAYASGTIGGSGYFDGTGDSLTISSATGLCNFTTGEAFTFQCWIYRLGTGSQIFIQGGANTFQITVLASTGGFTYGKAGVSDLFYGVGACPLSTWTHVTLCRNTSSQSRMWVNGVSVASSSSDTYAFNAASTSIGANNPPTSSFVNGILSDMRIIKGQALYDPTSSANIAVPTAPLTAVTNTSFLLNFTNAAVLDNAMIAVLETVGNAQISTTVKKYGTGSLAFDGSGDYLSAPFDNGRVFGTGDFTIEYWINPTSNTSGSMLDLRSTELGAGGVAYSDYFTATGKLGIYISGNTYVSTSTVQTGQWTHIAISRSGTSLRVFFNGIQDGATVSNSQNLVGGPLKVGINVALAGPLNGYIDDLRITKGVARYTASFTPPTAAFPDL